MSGPTAEGDDKHGLVEVPPPWSCALILRQLPLVALDWHRARVEDTHSTATCQIRLRLLVLDRFPVPLRGVEPLARARVLPDPALPRYPGPCLGVFRWPRFPRLLDRSGSTEH